jgi:hypothetical protein
MICVRAPRVRYASAQELVRLCAGVLDAYAEQVDTVVRDIWNEQHTTTKWSEYDRLILGIFCFDDVLLSTMDKTRESTKNRGAIYACTLHREICMRLNEAIREYMHSNAVPVRAHLLTALQRVLADAVLMGRTSHMMRLLAQNFCRCRDASGDPWLVCPKHKLPAYTLALCMSQHRRLGVQGELHAVPGDVLRVIVSLLFATTSWDLHPMDSQVEVSVPV